ncbi:MAG: helix-turn-helix domain-containing protein [Bacilli bacterium]|nr:helix-turn-helix domain-containing protein [Bacilli bacterium]
MSIGQKLSDLRKSKHLSQEEVADRLGVTRQTISKWETDQSTPDFDKIIPICELYGLSSDELLGNVNSDDNKEKKGEQPVSIEDNKENNIMKRKKSIGVSLGILSYFLAIVWIMIAIPVLTINPIVASAIFLLICGIATFIIVYSCMFYSKDKKEEKEELNPNKRIAKQVNEIIAMIILIIYLIISFTTFAWHITWIIWIVYGLIEQIVNLIFDLRGANDEK